ncbi:hypothetical protein SAMN02799634_1017 [Bacillus sp. UNCCL13]|nr:hypothetical protein SAMN02799634_1017 [Bacillus sp. UNCCL13]
MLNLRNLTRQHENITGVTIQTKLQFQAVLEQVFPEYKGVFGDLYSVVSLLTLSEFPSSEDIIEASEETLQTRYMNYVKVVHTDGLMKKLFNSKLPQSEIRLKRLRIRVIF